MEQQVENYYLCPFCKNKLSTKFSKCFNQYCGGQEFNVGNKVIYRLNPKLGIGKIIKKLEIPYSKKLDGEDTLLLANYKVLFPNNLNKIIHPVDLIHQVYELNEQVVTKNGVGVVNSNEILIQKGNLSYEILFPNGNIEQVQETEIYSEFEPTFKELINQKRIAPPQQFLIKYWASLFQSYYTSYQIKCITNSRLTLMSHQINVAHRLSEELFAKVILADEVGLGKTIEAGIYLKEMMARNLAERILVIVPATLVKQWQFELDNKFNIKFKIYDGKKIKKLNKKGNIKNPELLQNPFYYDNLIICSLQFARNPKYADFISQISWDIVIFDEAHHLRRYLTNASTGNFRETLNYRLAKNVSQNCESLLLLTATPLQMHSFELFSLIELVQPEAFENFGDFEHFRKNMPFINLLVSNLNNIDQLNTFEIKNTLKLLKDLKYISNNKNKERILSEIENPDFKQSLIKSIEQDHTLSKFLIRNRKKNVFTKDILNKRVVKTIMVYPTEQELTIYNEIRLYLAKIYNASISKQNVGLGFVISTLQKLLTSSKYAFLKSLERRLEHINGLKNLAKEIETIKTEDPEYYEVELEAEDIDTERGLISLLTTTKKSGQGIDFFNQEKILMEFHDKLSSIPYDSKSDTIIELLSQLYKNNAHEKVLVFTQFVDTLFYLKKLIEEQEEDYFVEVFYGGLNKQEKSESVEKFKESKKFSILLSTEIGGEGRNFQFCRILINFDLPWNPMKLEQRIGRLDRIGQQAGEIYIYNFFLEGTIEADIIFALNKRINLFEESIGVLEPILGKIEKDFKDLVFSETMEKPKKLKRFTQDLDEQLQKAREIEMQLDDLLIDKKSFKMDDLITSIAYCDEVKLSHNELFLLINYFFELDEGKFGNFTSEIINKEAKEPHVNSIIYIGLNPYLLQIPNYKLSEQYKGTFGLELAKNREDIDFFALGHPLINDMLDFCMSNAFEGKFTILKIIKTALPSKIIEQIAQSREFYLFVFSVKFQGYIVEKQLVPIVLDERGMELSDITDYLLLIENYKRLFLFSQVTKEDFTFDWTSIQTLKKQAKEHIKSKTNTWKKDVIKLNNKIFNQEKIKKEKIYHHKKSVLQHRIETLKSKFERKSNQKPTERQLQNIRELKDVKKKEERKKNIEKLYEQITFLEKKIQRTEKELDDLSFWFSDVKNEMKKRNISKYYTNLEFFAKVLVV